MKYQKFFFSSLILIPVSIWFYMCLLYTETRSMSVTHLCLLAYASSVLAALSLFFAGLKKMIEGHRSQREISVLKHLEETAEQQRQKLSGIQKQAVEKQENFYRQLRLIENRLKCGDFSDAEKLLEHLNRFNESTRLPVYCPDYFLNAVLQAKKEEGEKAGILVQYHIFLPAEGSLSLLPVTELSSLFFNLLDNGIEACSQAQTIAPQISLTAVFQEHMLSVSMENTKNETISFQKKSEKKDSMFHGFGLEIIEQIVNKYGGVCQWEDRGSTFFSSLVIPLTEPDKEKGDTNAESSHM